MSRLEELTAELLEVETAYATYLKGEQLTTLTIGVGESRRQFGYAEITGEFFNKERTRLRKEIAALNAAPRTFKRSAYFRTTYRKL